MWLRVSLIWCPFSRMIVKDSPLEYRTCLSRGLGPENGTGYGLWPMQWRLDSMKMWLVTPAGFMILWQQWICLANPVIIGYSRVYSSIALMIIFSSAAHIEPSSAIQASQEAGCFQRSTVLTSPCSMACRYTTLKLPNVTVSYSMTILWSF